MDTRFLDSTKFGIVSSLLRSRSVSDGEPVNALTTNCLPRTTAENAEYLHELIRMGFNNSAMFLWDMPISDEVVIGDLNPHR